MVDSFILENAHLQMRVNSLGGKVQSLFSRQCQIPVLYDNPAGGMFPMIPMANRVSDNRFLFVDEKSGCPAIMRMHVSSCMAMAGYNRGKSKRNLPVIVYCNCVRNIPADSIIWR